MIESMLKLKKENAYISKLKKSMKLIFQFL